MSRHSGSSSSSSRRHGHNSGSMDSNSEGLVEQIKGTVEQLNDVTASRPWEWQTYLVAARSAVTALEHTRFFRVPNRLPEQAWIIHGLQDYAFHDPDSGHIADIATFCQTSWLRILRTYPENVEILSGLGHNWLQRAQATLARIAREERSDTGSSGSSQAASSSTDPRRQGPLYVEARGLLRPAVDFYARAVRSADALGMITGDVLTSAAESQMSLGNVTASPEDEALFSQAIRYLRRAAAIPGYALTGHLQTYLDDYGRYVS